MSPADSAENAQLELQEQNVKNRNLHDKGWKDVKNKKSIRPLLEGTQETPKT